MGYIGVVTHILTIDPNFPRNIQDSGKFGYKNGMTIWYLKRWIVSGRPVKGVLNPTRI